VPGSTVRLVSGFREGGLIAIDGNEPVRPGDLVVMVLGPPEPTDGGSTPAAKPGAPMVEVITAFAGRGAVVLAAPPEANVAGSVLRAVRDDAALASRLSSVDNCGTPSGDVVVVLALADAVRREFGHYGTGPGASAPLPSSEPAAA